MTTIVDLHPVHDISEQHASFRPGMGYITIEDHPPIPRAHLEFQVESACGRIHEKIICDASTWAHTVGQMIELAGIIGGEFQEKMEQQLARRPKLN